MIPFDPPNHYNVKNAIKSWDEGISHAEFAIGDIVKVTGHCGCYSYWNTFFDICGLSKLMKKQFGGQIQKDKIYKVIEYKLHPKNKYDIIYVLLGKSDGKTYLMNNKYNELQKV